MIDVNKLVLLLFIVSLIGFGIVHSACSISCTSCTNDTCMQCKVGRYLGLGSCHTCPEHCTACYNSQTCYNCVDGYFGSSCASECSVMCLKSSCDKDNGICKYGCIEGYFLSGASCSECNVNCKTCSLNSNNCLDCKEGNYGPGCQNSCLHCKDGICTRDNCTYGCRGGFYKGSDTCNNCSTSCTHCSVSFDNCQACVDGYFGPACQFLCSECSRCNKGDGSCSTIITQPTSPSKESFTTLAPTTAIFTTTSTNTSLSPTNTDTNYKIHYWEDSSMDNATVKFVAAGCGGLVVIVMIVVIVVVCKRRGRGNQSDIVAENIDMTVNENYISADVIDGSTRNSTNAHTEVNPNREENVDDIYSLPNKTHRSTVVTMEPRSAERPADNRTRIPPKLPVKSNLYSDLI